MGFGVNYNSPYSTYTGNNLEIIYDSTQSLTNKNSNSQSNSNESITNNILSSKKGTYCTCKNKICTIRYFN